MSQLTVQRRHKKKTPLGLLAAGAASGLGEMLPAGAGGNAPSLIMAEPDDAKSSIISGSITTAVHAGALGILILLAWLAPPIEEIIRVKIIRELPGADVKPAPAPKILKRRQRQPIHRARKITAQAVAQPRVKMTPQQMKMNELNKTVAPQVVRRRVVTSTRTDARVTSLYRVAENIDLSKFQEVSVPTDLDAPVVYYDGPVEIVPGAQVAENFAEVPDVRDVDYTSQAPFEIIAEDLDDLEAFEFDTDVGVYAGGDGTGGTGKALGVVECLNSAYVQRYLKRVTTLTETRWRVPEGVPENAKLKLAFVIDSSGTATRVEFAGDVEPAFGNSAVAALRAASPFPPMDDNVRCLAGKRLFGTFSVENM